MQSGIRVEAGSLEKEDFSRKISFLKPLWWVIHFVGISVVYTIGHLLWR
jgi:hypothetical protein